MGYKTANHPLFFIRAAVDRTLPNDTNENPIFNVPNSGALQLIPGVYTFEGSFIFTSMSATSGNLIVNLLGAGSATITSWLWHANGLDTSIPSSQNTTSGTSSQTQVTGSVAIASTGTGLRLTILGHFEVTVAGTLIPSITLTTAAAAVVEAGSFLTIRRLGDNSLVSIGNWI